MFIMCLCEIQRFSVPSWSSHLIFSTSFSVFLCWSVFRVHLSSRSSGSCPTSQCKHTCHLLVLQCSSPGCHGRTTPLGKKRARLFTDLYTSYRSSYSLTHQFSRPLASPRYCSWSHRSRRRWDGRTWTEPVMSHRCSAEHPGSRSLPDPSEYHTSCMCSRPSQ